MASGYATYRVLNRSAPKAASDGIVQSIANLVRDTVAAQSPRDSGHYAASWQVAHLKAGVYQVFNPVPYGKYVEYGTRDMPAQPVFGRVIASVRARVSR
jgi:HK97 gp10 family phage protein